MKKDLKIALEKLLKTDERVDPKDRDYKHKKAFPTPKKLEKTSKGLSQAISLRSNPSKFKVQISSPKQNVEDFYRKKITPHKLKEKSIAKKNLEIVTKELQEWIYANTTRDIKIVNNEEKRNDWESLMQKHEERHFQIDRIIKYLSD